MTIMNLRPLTRLAAICTALMFAMPLPMQAQMTSVDPNTAIDADLAVPSAPVEPAPPPAAEDVNGDLMYRARHTSRTI
jgi:hypothetical protein